MRFLTAIRDKIWDALFLDFYLDPHWTLEFKVLNLISGDFLRGVVTELHHHLQDHTYPNPQSLCVGCPGENLHWRKAKFWSDAAWDAWRRE